jgi:hypothetical protein
MRRPDGEALSAPSKTPAELYPGGLEDDTVDVVRERLVAQDQGFQRAMANAIARGKETAPMVVSTRPGTKRPLLVPYGPPEPPHTRSTDRPGVDDYAVADEEENLDAVYA